MYISVTRQQKHKAANGKASTCARNLTVYMPSASFSADEIVTFTWLCISPQSSMHLKASSNSDWRQAGRQGEGACREREGGERERWRGSGGLNGAGGGV